MTLVAMTRILCKLYIYTACIHAVYYQRYNHTVCIHMVVSLAFWISVLTITPPKLPDITILPTPTCLCGSLSDTSVAIITTKKTLIKYLHVFGCNIYIDADCVIHRHLFNLLTTTRLFYCCHQIFPPFHALHRFDTPLFQREFVW